MWCISPSTKASVSSTPPPAMGTVEVRLPSVPRCGPHRREGTQWYVRKIALSEGEETCQRLAEDFYSRVEHSLRRLRRDHIDILLLHNPSDRLDWRTFEPTILENLKSSGKILTYGVSCRSFQSVQAVLDGAFGTCIEWVFNIFERRPVAQIFPTLSIRRVNFIARSPLSRGLISPRFAEGHDVTFDSEEFRSTLPRIGLSGRSAPSKHSDHSAGFRAD